MTDTNTLLGWLNQFVTHRRIDEVMDEADYEAVQDMNTHLRAQEARIAELAPWKEAVIDALAVCCGDCAIGTPPSDVLKLIASINQQFTEQNCKDREDERIAALSKDAERLKFFNQVWRWKALKDGEIIYQYGEHVPSLFQKTAELLPTHQPAPKAITASNVDADIEYWRQKYLKLDAMYDELEKEKIAIEQNLMDRT